MPNRPLPTRLKLLRGTAQPCRMNPREPVPPPGVDLTPPADMTGAALDFWKQLAPPLGEMRIMGDADRHILRLACLAYADGEAAREVVRKVGVVIPTKAPNGVVTLRSNPACRLASDADKRLRLALTELGCTPSSRSRVSSTGADAEPAGDFAGLKR